MTQNESEIFVNFSSRDNSVKSHVSAFNVFQSIIPNLQVLCVCVWCGVGGGVGGGGGVVCCTGCIYVVYACVVYVLYVLCVCICQGFGRWGVVEWGLGCVEISYHHSWIILGRDRIFFCSGSLVVEKIDTRYNWVRKFYGGLGGELSTAKPLYVLRVFYVPCVLCIVCCVLCALHVLCVVCCAVLCTCVMCVMDVAWRVLSAVCCVVLSAVCVVL